MNEKRFFTILADDEYTLIQKKGNLRATYLKYSEVVDLLNELVEENERLQKNMENLQEVVAELGATLLVNGFEIEINGENLSELIDDE